MGRQLALPLESGAEPDPALMHAWSDAQLTVPYDVAIRVPALAICLRNLAAIENRRSIRRTLRARLRLGRRHRHRSIGETD